MKILSIETSGSICGTALTNDGEMLAEYNSYGSNSHDKLLGDFVRRILKDTETDLTEIDYVAVSAGPGSFTGLRIGGAMAKALCLGDSPRLIAVPTLDAIAYQVSKAGLAGYSRIIVAVKSHKDLYYYRTFDTKGEPLREVRFDTMDNIRAEINETDFLCGSGFAELPTASFTRGVRSCFIADLALKMIKSGVAPVLAADYEPFYVQEFEPKTF